MVHFEKGEDTLWNRFMERYESEERQRVRSRTGRNLKKKAQCWRRKKNEKEEGEESFDWRGITRVTTTVTPYYTTRALASLPPPLMHVDLKGAIGGQLWNLFPHESICENCFKKRVKLKKYTTANTQGSSENHQVLIFLTKKGKGKFGCMLLSNNGSFLLAN
jgi:hypothetical protein